MSPSAPNITEHVLQEGQVSLSWTQLPTDIVDSYAISVSTSPMGCEADVETMEDSLNGSERTFRTNDLEEFSEITITVSAQNEIGESSTVVVITTPSAGEALVKLHIYILKINKLPLLTQTQMGCLKHW